MTPEAQCIAIAEACGWVPETRAMYAGEKNVKGWGFNTHLDKGDADRKFTENVGMFPDYLNDLNAMNAAELYVGEHSWDSDKWEMYGRNLERVHPSALLKCNTSDNVDYYDFATLMTSSAAQRACAFLRTIGKWQD